jgi:Txe/YoeB family toxin of toxin-antitoxin system
MPLTPLNEIDPVGEIEFSFLNDDVGKMFKDQLENEKMKTMINDISYKPWATKGDGKPEVLKYKYENHKGCLSRHINGEDRLVYKPIGTRQVLILSCKGHYKK